MLNSSFADESHRRIRTGGVSPVGFHQHHRRHPAGAVRQVGWVHVRDETVSGLQAELVWQPESKKFRLVNRSNTNPTKVNEVEAR